MEYEICYLIGESKEANLDRIRKVVESIIKEHQGKLGKDEFVKKRRLSYEIKKEARGTYVAKRFSLPNKDDREEKFPGIDFIGEITKELNFNQDVLRFVIVKADDVPSLAELKKKEEVSKKETDTRGKERFAERTPSRKSFVKKDNTKSDERREQKKVSIVKKAEDKKDAKKSVSNDDKKVSSKKEISDEKKIIKKESKKVDDTEKISEKNIDDKLDEILNI